MKRLAILAVLIALAGTVALLRRGEAGREVTVYTSVDQVYSEPVFKAFEARTGIRVNALYDAEAAKTVGLVNRLIAERGAPLADVFWNGEVLQTLALKDEAVLARYVSPSAAGLPPGLTDPDGTWAGFGGRARVLLVNTALMAEGARPASVLELPERAGELAIANPLFGSTATHAAALAAALGPDTAVDLFAQLKAQGGRFVDGNAVVRDMVASGRAPMGLTDTDDACVAIASEAPVAAVFLDQQPGGLGTLVVPNSVALIAGAPHPEAGQALIDDLLAPATEAALVEAGWVQIPSRPLDVAARCYGKLDLRPMAVSMVAIRASGLEIGPRLRALMLD